MPGAVCTRSILGGWRMSYRGLVEVSWGVRTMCSAGAPPNTALSAQPTLDHRANRAWAQGHLAALRVPLFCRGLAQRVVSAKCADRVSVRRSARTLCGLRQGSARDLCALCTEWHAEKRWASSGSMQ